ncbi:MAG: ammonium transporter, partial [Prochlorothrix sp.]
MGDRSFITGIFRDISERKRAESQMQSLMAQLQATSAALQDKNAALETAMETLKRTQAQLIQQEKMASLEKMVGGIAHEFNNPVNYIFGNLVHLQQYAQDLLSLLQSYQAQYPEPGPAIAAEIEAIDLEFIQDDLPKILQSIQ